MVPQVGRKRLRVAQVMLGDMYNCGRKCRRIMPRRRSGAVRRQKGRLHRRAVRPRLHCTNRGKACRRTTPRRRRGTARRPKGHPQGQFGLGRLYADGNGVLQDYVLAHMWLNLAAAQGLRCSETARRVGLQDDPRPGSLRRSAWRGSGSRSGTAKTMPEAARKRPRLE